MRTTTAFIIIMWILDLSTMNGTKTEWDGDLQSCLKAAYEYNEKEENKHTFAGCYPHFVKSDYPPEDK